MGWRGVAAREGAREAAAAATVLSMGLLTLMYLAPAGVKGTCDIGGCSKSGHQIISVEQVHNCSAAASQRHHRCHISACSEFKLLTEMLDSLYCSMSTTTGRSSCTLFHTFWLSLHAVWLTCVHKVCNKASVLWQLHIWWQGLLPSSRLPDPWCHGPAAALLVTSLAPTLPA
jgi:hypothetical protein